ncbi:MAG: mechanosensitive ion channel [Roseburia sp.]|uniref:mechanosensitive ion channel family protein n=1 Tax=Roseburia sp. 831b TaxID=1261635 RepID=UPI000952950D|nr:mechanosensitive ion channel domain-containing protein [Roseburia sp. 831b]MCI5917752.1 mechanosensitive ion channel [Roseburia sp.]MDY5883110.1 mechanosensitive ion channel [Roseburia sp.]WVK73681.1 mechanosensitive ion channel [Roseburia sp. 831b]
MNILATIDSTEIVDTLTNAQENMQQNVEEVAKNPGIIRTYFENLVPDLISFGLQVVIAILIYVVGAKIIKAILKMMNRSMERAGTDIGVKQFLSTVIKYALYIILIMIILNLFGIATTSVVALIGSAGVAVGLALQGSLANIAGGVLILFLKPFRVGDYIIEDTNKNEGTVAEISVFYTKLLTIDNKVVMIPNGILANASLTNVSHMDKRRVDLVVGVSYEADIKKTKEVLQKVIEEEPARLKDEEMQVFVSELADSSVNMGVRVWVKAEEYWPAKWRITENVKLALDKNGISIPYPQLDVQIRQ